MHFPEGNCAASIKTASCTFPNIDDDQQMDPLAQSYQMFIVGAVLYLDSFIWRWFQTPSCTFLKYMILIWQEHHQMIFIMSSASAGLNKEASAGSMDWISQVPSCEQPEYVELSKLVILIVAQ